MIKQQTVATGVLLSALLVAGCSTGTVGQAPVPETAVAVDTPGAAAAGAPTAEEAPAEYRHRWRWDWWRKPHYPQKPVPEPSLTPTPPPTLAPTPTPTPQPTATPAPVTGVDPMVAEVHRLVNAERAKVGAKALTLSSAINEVAQFRSDDMAKRNYFSHTDPDGHDPFYWLKQFGVSYRTAGENIAMGQTSAAQVMNGWMNSSGHKANILKTSFGKIGIGVAKNSSGRLYWTQLFTD